MAQEYQKSGEQTSTMNRELESHAKEVQQKFGGDEHASVLTAVVPADHGNKSAEVRTKLSMTQFRILYTS